MTDPGRTVGGSPPTVRVVRVIEYLSARPHDPKNVTDIARDLGIARATCALVVESLAESGWLVQTSSGYVLGPRLVPLGRAALASPTSGALAHDELASLAEDLDLICTTSGVIGEQIVVLDRAGPLLSPDFDVQVGMQFPFTPPSGIVNVAWQPDAIIDAWLRRSPRPLSDEDRRRLWEAVRDARSSGMFVERLSPQVFQLWTLLAGLAADDMTSALRSAIGDAMLPLASRGYRSRDLLPGHKYPVSLIVAPTFDSTGHQHLVLSAVAAQHELPYRRVMQIAERVKAAADHVTKHAGGVNPWT